MEGIIIVIAMVIYIFQDIYHSRNLRNEVNAIKNRRIASVMISDNFIENLTENLDIEADGGDSPEGFVRFAVDTALARL